VQPPLKLGRWTVDLDGLLASNERNAELSPKREHRRDDRHMNKSRQKQQHFCRDGSEQAGDAMATALHLPSDYTDCQQRVEVVLHEVELKATKVA
jgi:hypothetical protein